MTRPIRIAVQIPPGGAQNYAVWRDTVLRAEDAGVDVLLGYDHFVVFRGVYSDRVQLADPAWGNRIMPLERFEAAWLTSPEFGRVAFVVARVDGRPPPDRLAPRPEDFFR